MAEPDPAGVGGMLGGNDEATSVFRGTADVKVNYKDVTGLTKQMDLLAKAIKNVHDALGSLNETKIQKALSGLQGIGGAGGGGGTGGSGQPGSTAAAPNGGFRPISRGMQALGVGIGAASVLAGAYDRRAQGDLTSDITALRTVYTSDKPSFGLREATTMNAQQMGPVSFGREDALAGAAALSGRYGMAGSPGQAAAARGAGVLAMGSQQGAAFGADMYNALNQPTVINRMRMFGGVQTGGQVKDVTGFSQQMARVAFGTENPTMNQLTHLRPGFPQFENLMMLTGGDPMLATQMSEQMRMRSRYESMGSPRGPWNDELVQTINKDRGLQRMLLGGEESLVASRQQFEAGKGMQQEELLGLSRAGLVTTNDLLADISGATHDLLKEFQKWTGPLGNLTGGLGGGAGAMGQGLNIATDVMMMRALGGGGGGGGLIARLLGRGGAGAAGEAAAGAAGQAAGAGVGGAGLGLLGRAGIAGAGAWGAQQVDNMIGNPATKSGFDWGNAARWGATGAAIGSVVPGVGTLLGAGIGGGLGLLGGLGTELSDMFGGGGGLDEEKLIEAFLDSQRGRPQDLDKRDKGDPVGASPFGTQGGIGDPAAPSGPQPGGGMTVSQAEDLLKSRGGHVQGVAGLKSDFKIKLATLFAQNPKLSLSSGARNRAEQERLYQRWINRVPGQARAAKPGTSNHEFGLAADIGPSSEYGWLAANAPGVGLVKPMNDEPWHWEPPGAKQRRGEPDSGQQTDAGMSVDAAAGPAIVASQVERVGPSSKGRKGPIRAASLSGTALSGVAGGGMAVGGGTTPSGPAAGGISINAAAQAARAAGVPPDQVATAVAIAMAESGLNASAHNPVPPDDSYGLWQINMIGNMGPARRQSIGISKNEELFNPTVNARAMMQISGGGHNWGPWSTYGNNAYQGHMAAVNTALQTGVGDAVPDAAPPQNRQSQPMVVTTGRSGGGGVTTIQAPIYVTVKDASDAEAERFARKVGEHLNGVVADINRAREGR